MGKFLSNNEWLTWVFALTCGALSMVVFVFSTFETKADGMNREGKLEKRLDRLESKVDLLLQQTR